MQFLKGHIEPKTYELAKHSGAKIMCLTEYPKHVNFIKALSMGRANGFYDWEIDAVVISIPNCQRNGIDIDEAVLHELVHWTGHPKRLERNGIAIHMRNARLGMFALQSEEEQEMLRKVYATEEIIAETGMYIAAKELGLSKTEFLQHRMERYCGFYKHGDFMEANLHTHPAVQFLLNGFESKLMSTEEFLQSSAFMK